MFRRLMWTLGLIGLVATGSAAADVVAAQPVPVPAPVAVAAPTRGGGEDLGDGTRLAEWQLVNGVKVFNLHLAPMAWEVKKGDVKQAFAINGSVPGPTIRVNEGDRLRFLVRNDLPEPTTIHWHGMVLPNDQDGVPDLTQPMIEPGQTYTYEWTAISTGTHWYHSHMGGDQEGRGVYGALEVVPRFGDIPAERDYTIEIGDGPLGFVFNGKSFPATVPLRAKVGDRVHFRLIGTGPEMIHPIHLHGGSFDLVAQDGKRLPFPQRMDTVLVGVGQTYDIVYTATVPGKWMLHCHIFSHSETSEGMSGLVSILYVDPPVLRVPELTQPAAPPSTSDTPTTPAPLLPPLPLLPS